MQLDKPLLITLRNAVSIFSNQKNTNTSYTSVISFITVLLAFLYVLNSTALIMLPTFIVTLLTLQCWQLIFKPAYRNIAPSAHTLLCAMLFSLLLPLEITHWALVLCVSFGTVFGERVFGGRGFFFASRYSGASLLFIF